MPHVPAETPVTTPVAGFTVAIAGFPLDQLPPPVASVKVVVDPTAVVVVPPIAAGAGTTVKVIVTKLALCV